MGKGEQGILICEPYKSEIGQYWRFKTKAIADESSQRIFGLFENYLKPVNSSARTWPGKYLQMAYTRARRYANYKGGTKYNKEQDYALLERGTGDPEKAAAAEVFYQKWKEAEANVLYKSMKKDWKNERG